MMVRLEISLPRSAWECLQGFPRNLSAEGGERGNQVSDENVPLSDSPVCKKPRCFQKNTIKHLLTQSSCERVLLTGVITSEKCNPVVDPIAGAVPKLWTCFQFCPSQLAKAIEHSVEPDFPETHNDAQISEKLKFANHERPEIFYLLWKQFVLWRRT